MAGNTVLIVKLLNVLQLRNLILIGERMQPMIAQLNRIIQEFPFTSLSLSLSLYWFVF